PKGVFFASQAVLPTMMAQKHGAIVSLASCSRATTLHMSVSTKPGHTQFTWIPSAAWASAKLFVMLITAALLALYGRVARLPILPASAAQAIARRVHPAMSSPDPLGAHGAPG